jgi:hypothetical protein
MRRNGRRMHIYTFTFVSVLEGHPRWAFLVSVHGEGC